MTATLKQRPPARRSAGTHVHDTLIIGAGFAGLGTAIKLREAGVEDLVILERADRVGGTWRDNNYPGAACDIPSLLYSYSFAPNPKWSRAYSPSDEICRHIEELADRFDLRRHIRFDANVEGLVFDEAEGVWDIATSGGDAYRARTVVAASGPLADASFPQVRGIDTFTGQKILSARWDHDYDLRGKRVAVIGTGASAIQIVPELVKVAESVKVFQRTPGWVMPRLDMATPKVAQAAFTKVPALQQAARTALFLAHEVAATGLVWDTPVTTLIQKIGLAHLRVSVKDPWLRRQLTPDFRAGCKRMLMSSDFYPALQRENCKLITWPIATISPNGLRTSDGVEHDVDCTWMSGCSSWYLMRNVRAYQDRGLLHPPRRSGRVTLFNDIHLARLRLIGSMLDRGYSSAHILEMLSAWEHGKDLADVLGLEKALVTPWGHERPTTMTIAEARELAGGSDDLQRLIDADLVRLKGKRAVTERPKLLQVFAEMRTYGMPLNKLLELHEQVQAPIDEISRALVNAGAHHVAKQFEPDLEPTSTEVTELITTLVAFRTLAMTSVTASIGASIEHAVERVLGDYLAQLMASGSASENVS